MAIPARQRPTRRQLEVLRAYIRAGSVAAAAYELGIGETTVRQHLSGLYRRAGCVNAAQAAYWLGTGGLDSGRKVGPTTLARDGRSPGRTAFDPEYHPRGKGILNRRAYGT